MNSGYARIALTRASLLMAAALFAFIAHAEPPKRTVLPTRFDHGLIYVTPELIDGSTLSFYTDSGGGLNMVREDVAQRHTLNPAADVVFDGARRRTVAWPTFTHTATIPSPVVDHYLEGRLALFPASGTGEGPLRHEGLLGNRWFGGRIWEFDYPGQHLSVLSDWTPPDNAPHIAFTMQAERGFHWPRVIAEIDGQPLPLLFDTGAQFRLDIDAARAFKRGEGELIGGSFISRRQFEQWRTAHPDWSVLEKGDDGEPMIQVSNVRLAGRDLGPASFSARNNESFTQFMSSMTDAPVEGALGPSAFARVRMVADYPAQRLYVLDVAER